MMILSRTWKKRLNGGNLLNQLLLSSNVIWLVLSVTLVMVLASVISIMILLMKYSAELKQLRNLSMGIFSTQEKLTHNYSSLSKNLDSLTQVNDKITTMLGTKGPLEFQAVQAMQSANAYDNIDYVDPSDEAEVRRINDLTGSNNTAGTDDELPTEYIPSQWNDWDDPAFVAKSATEGPY